VQQGPKKRKPAAVGAPKAPKAPSAEAAVAPAPDGEKDGEVDGVPHAAKRPRGRPPRPGAANAPIRRQVAREASPETRRTENGGPTEEAVEHGSDDDAGAVAAAALETQIEVEEAAGRDAVSDEDGEAKEQETEVPKLSRKQMARMKLGLGSVCI
jgi:hypothetical protein